MKRLALFLLFLPVFSYGQEIDTLSSGDCLQKASKHMVNSTMDAGLAIVGLGAANMYFRLYLQEKEPAYLRAALAAAGGSLVFTILSIRHRFKVADYLELAGAKLNE